MLDKNAARALMRAMNLLPTGATAFAITLDEAPGKVYHFALEDGQLKLERVVVDKSMVNA